MSHEQSETIQDSKTGRWRNVYGRNVARGLTIPLEPGITYATAKEAVQAARTRSRMAIPESKMPKGGHMKGDWGDVGEMRQMEAEMVGGFKDGQRMCVKEMM